MNNETIILISLTAVILIAFVTWLIKFRVVEKIKSLFDGTGFIDVIPKNQEEKAKSVLIADIESIIKSSENLDRIISSSEEGGRLYEKILLDKDLVPQIKIAKDKKEVETILSGWLEKKWSPENSTQTSVNETATASDAPNQTNASQAQTPSQEQNSQIRKIKKPRKKRKKSARKIKNQTLLETSTQITQEITPVATSNWTGKSKEIYEEIKNLLESRNMEKLIDIIKTLSESQIEEILKHYFENFETNKFGAILKQASSPKDVTNLLKSETIKGLEWEYERIKGNVSAARRKGIDTKSEALKLLGIPHKIKMFQATFDKKDFYKVRNSLIEIENSLKEKENKK